MRENEREKERKREIKMKLEFEKKKDWTKKLIHLTTARCGTTSLSSSNEFNVTP